MISNDGAHPSALRAAMNGDKFANAVAIANDRLRSFAAILLILRRDATGTEREEDVVGADGQLAFENGVRHETRARADAHGGADDAIGSDFSIGSDFGFGVNERGGMNGHDGNAGRLRGRRFDGLAAFVTTVGGLVGEDELAHQSCFGDDLTVNGGDALHLRHGVFEAEHLHLNAKLIARHDRPAEFSFFDGSEKHDLAASVRSERAYKDAGYLRHGLYNEHARHNGIAGKMADEVRLVDGDILDPDDRIIGDFHDSVDHQHRITVRQKRSDFLNIQRGHGNRYYNNR